MQKKRYIKKMKKDQTIMNREIAVKELKNFNYLLEIKKKIKLYN